MSCESTRMKIVSAMSKHNTPELRLKAFLDGQKNALQEAITPMKILPGIGRIAQEALDHMVQYHPEIVSSILVGVDESHPYHHKNLDKPAV